MRSSAVLLVLLALPPSADAATVTVTPGAAGEAPVVRFRAAPGERNRVTVSQVAPTVTGAGPLRYRDPANRVVARDGCVPVDAHTVTCDAPGARRVILLGDRDDAYSDRTTVPGTPEAFGGPGDDVLRGRRGPDRLTGGPGRDRLFGGRDPDTLVDGENPRRPARDLLDGGTSQLGDTVDYARRTAPLRIRLGRRGRSTEDRLVGIEHLVGGSGDDRLTGDADGNRLEGRGGDDVLRGGPGDDDLDGGDGEDELQGRRGDDTLRAWGDDEADAVACGSDTDAVISESLDTLLDCETLTTAAPDGPVVALLPVADADSADFTLSCRQVVPLGCRGALTLRGPSGGLYGTVDYDVRAQALEAIVRVPLTPAGKTAIQAGATLVVDVAADAATVSARDLYGYRLVLP